MSVTTIEILLANLMLGAILGLGVAMSLGALTGSTWLLTAGVFVIVLVAGVIVLVWRLVFHTDSTVRATDRLISHLRFIPPKGAENLLRTMARQLRGLLSRRSRRARALVFTALNWLLDAAVLWIMLCAFGTPPQLGGVITVYAVGCLVSMLPITPGGLGVVEGFMVPALVVLGTTQPTALVAVLAWRLLEYWLPLPLAAGSWISLWLEVIKTKSYARQPHPEREVAPTPSLTGEDAAHKIPILVKGPFGTLPEGTNAHGKGRRSIPSLGQRATGTDPKARKQLD